MGISCIKWTEEHSTRVSIKYNQTSLYGHPLNMDSLLCPWGNRPSHGFQCHLDELSGQMHEKVQCLYENLMSNNFRKMTVLKKI